MSESARDEHTGIGRLAGAADDELAPAVLQGSVAQPLASTVGLVAWAARVAPELAVGSARLLANPRRLRRRLHGHSRTARALSSGLDELATGPKGVTSPNVREVLDLARDRAGHRVSVGIPYGPAPGQTLDIWRSADADPAGAPVFVYLPGGGWITGTTMLQGTVLLGHLAARGWIGVAVGYRTSPAHRWPTHANDVKRALAWVHQHIGEHGGDPSTVAIGGASAGGHLAALAGLTNGDPSWQPGFESLRTDVDAVVGIYGRYDWEGRETAERHRFMGFLEKMVVGQRQSAAPDVFAAASPLRQVHEGAPPFFVIHGRSDAIIPVAQARAFVHALRGASAQPVAYAELPGTGHGFDIVDPFRAAHMARAVEHFLHSVLGEPGAAARRPRVTEGTTPRSR